MIRLLAACAVLALGLPAGASPVTRWNSQAVEGVTGLVSGGPGGTTAVALRQGMDPLRSFDGGQSWSPFTVKGARPDDLKISPSDSRTWYAVLSDGSDDRVPRRIVRTRDGGDTWEERSRVLNRFALAPSIGPDPDTLYLAQFELPPIGFPEAPSTAADVMVSTDGGLTWTKRNPQAQVYRLAASPVDGRLAYATVFVAGERPLVRTRDGGATWTSMKLPNPSVEGLPVNLAFAHIVLDRVDSRIAYVRAEPFSAFAADIYVTRDGGENWSLATQPRGLLVADPLQAGRVYLLGFAGEFLESRDAGATWARVESAGPVKALAYSHAPPSVDFVVVSYEARRTALAPGLKLNRIDLTNGALALGSDLWWNPAESGIGLSITQHPSTNPFVVWYGYDVTGAATWRVIPGGQWNDRTFTGTLYETSGPPYFQGPFDPSKVSSRAVGTATLRFDDENNASFSYALAGRPAIEKRITRQLFAPPTSPTEESVADLYWNPNEPGWGIAINHQSSRIFATWYAYGDDGKPLWIVMPDAPVVQEFAGAILFPTASGDIYATRGPAEGAAFDPAKVASTKVGRAKLSWYSQNSAYLEYTAFGRTEVRAVRRQPF